MECKAQRLEKMQKLLKPNIISHLTVSFSSISDKSENLYAG